MTLSVNPTGDRERHVPRPEPGRECKGKRRDCSMSANVKLRRVRLVEVVNVTPSVSGTPMIAGPSDVAQVARAILPTDREGFAVLHLDARHRVRSIELVSVGSLNATIVHPREVFKAAILANAQSIILVHNHPSGDPEPSTDDIEMTKRLKRVGDLVGIHVLDHVVVTADSFVSIEKGGK